MIPKLFGILAWPQRAGNSHAQYHLGSMHKNGRGVAQDDGEAHSYWRLAADQGHAVAQVITGGSFRMMTVLLRITVMLFAVPAWPQSKCI